MAHRTKGPPRDVPTLTEVVTEDGVTEVAVSAKVLAESGAETEAEVQVRVQAMPPVALPPSGALPDPGSPVDLPGTNSVAGEQQTVSVEVPQAGLPRIVQASEIQFRGADARKNRLPEALEETVVQRVMQRVDLGLDQRLRDAIATVVQEQTRSLLPRLREEIESVVRQVACEAIADEVATGAAGKGRPG